jgi:hypothetical protein
MSDKPNIFTLSINRGIPKIMMLLVSLGAAEKGFCDESSVVAWGRDVQSPCVETCCKEPLSKWYGGIYGGYGVISGMYKNDGRMAQTRLVLGYNLASFWEHWTLGLELGVQSGAEMRVSGSSALISTAGGLHPQVTLKPFLDLLLAVRWDMGKDFSLFAKGGIAYRELHFKDRNSSKDSIQKVNGEFQAGIGYEISSHARLVAFYQGIYSENHVGLSLSSSGNVRMAHIPTQQAGFLGIEYTF